MRSESISIPWCTASLATSRGRTPILPASELERLGYRIAVAPIESLLVTARAVQELCAAFREEGRVDHLMPARMASFDEVKQILGLDEYLDVRERLERTGEGPSADYADYADEMDR